MEIIFIAVLFAAVLYAGLWKLFLIVLPVYLLGLIAFIVSEHKNIMKQEAKTKEPAPLIKPATAPMVNYFGPVW